MDGGAGGEDDGQPLRDPGGGGHQEVVGVRGEAGPEGCEDGQSAEHCSAPGMSYILNQRINVTDVT